MYAIIAGSQLRMRRQLEAEAPDRLKLRMCGYPWLTWVTLIGTVFVAVSMAFVESARSQLILSVLSLVAILLVYAVIALRGRVTPG